MWEHFNAPEPSAGSTMWYFGEVLNVLKKRLDDDIVREYEKIVTRARKVFKV